MQSPMTEERTLTFEPVRPHTTPDAQTERIPRMRPHLPERCAADLAAGVLRGLFRDAAVQALEPVEDTNAFRAAWRITLGNAASCANPIVAATASVLLDAAARLEPEELVEGLIVLHGRTWEVWIDTARLVLLASVARPDLDGASTV